MRILVPNILYCCTLKYHVHLVSNFTGCTMFTNPIKTWNSRPRLPSSVNWQIVTQCSKTKELPYFTCVQVDMQDLPATSNWVWDCHPPFVCTQLCPLTARIRPNREAEEGTASRPGVSTYLTSKTDALAKIDEVISSLPDAMKVCNACS